MAAVTAKATAAARVAQVAVPVRAPAVLLARVAPVAAPVAAPVLAPVLVRGVLVRYWCYGCGRLGLWCLGGGKGGARPDTGNFGNPGAAAYGIWYKRGGLLAALALTADMAAIARAITRRAVRHCG